jgi:hypothetical protein
MSLKVGEIFNFVLTMASEIHIMKNQQMATTLIYLKLHGNVKTIM